MVEIRTGKKLVQKIPQYKVATYAIAKKKEPDEKSVKALLMREQYLFRKDCLLLAVPPGEQSFTTRYFSDKQLLHACRLHAEPSSLAALRVGRLREGSMKKEIYVAVLKFSPVGNEVFGL